MACCPARKGKIISTAVRGRNPRRQRLLGSTLGQLPEYAS
jgi:hypothetical protein